MLCKEVEHEHFIFSIIMAYALGSLDPSICARLEECKTLLSEKGDPEILSQVLIEMGMLTKNEWRKKVHTALHL